MNPKHLFDEFCAALDAANDDEAPDGAWWHFCLYVPALASIGREITVFRVDRDEEYIDAMATDLLAFDALVFEYESALRKSPDVLRETSAGRLAA